MSVCLISCTEAKHGNRRKLPFPAEISEVAGVDSRIRIHIQALKNIREYGADMELELILLILAAFGLFMLRLLMIGREHRRSAARTLYLSGAICGGMVAGCFGLDDTFGIAVSVTAVAVFFIVGVIAYLLGGEKKEKDKPKDLPGGNMHRDVSGRMPNDRHL